MKIDQVIETIKFHCKGVAFDKPIDPETTRDQVLYGTTDKECTGIVVTCFADIKVIEKAHEQGANFIICHEALFWNHGDHTDWLQEVDAFKMKKQCLDQYGITVWRFHDYIHSGILLEDGTYTDGIFYGFMKQLGWENYLIESKEKPLLYEIPETTAGNLANEIIERCHLNGVKMIGNPEAKAHRVWIAEHIMGRGDNEKLTRIHDDKIDTILTLELTDSSITEFFRDSSLLGLDRTILAFGHFNTEEPGMAYVPVYVEQWLNHVVPIQFVQSGDMYHYIQA